MAAGTAITITFQAKDWETIIGLMDNNAYGDYRRLKQNLITYYAANGNPANTTTIAIATKQSMVMNIYIALYGNTVRNVYSDIGGSPFKRIIDSIKATALALNPTDSYLTTEIAAQDAIRDAAQVTMRKNGREIIMMDTYDNS